MMQRTVLYISKDLQNGAGIRRMFGIAARLEQHGIDTWANYTDSVQTPDIYPFSPIDNGPHARMERRRAAAGWMAARVIIIDEGMPLWRIRGVVCAATPDPEDMRSSDRRSLPVIQIVSPTADEQQISALRSEFPTSHLVEMEGVLGGQAVLAVFETVED